MKKIILTLSLLTALSAYSQEQNQTITMEMIPTYSIELVGGQINIATTYPIDVYVDDVVYPISVPGFHTIKIDAPADRILVLPHDQF